MVDTSSTTGFPILSTILLMIFAFAWIVYIWVAITALIDIFRRSDFSGWAKAAWVIIVVAFSWVGVLIYLIIYHNGMNERRAKEANAAKGQFDEYVRSVAVASSPATEIEKAKGLLDSGAINQAQFDAIKAKVLA